MKKLATLALTLAALTLLATDAQAFGRRGGCRVFNGPRQACNSCQPVTTAQPVQGGIRYFPQYQPATGSNPTTTGSTPTTGAAPVTVSNGCSNGTCTTTTPRFQLFRRR